MKISWRKSIVCILIFSFSRGSLPENRSFMSSIPDYLLLFAFPFFINVRGPGAPPAATLFTWFVPSSKRHFALDFPFVFTPLLLCCSYFIVVFVVFHLYLLFCLIFHFVRSLFTGTLQSPSCLLVSPFWIINPPFWIFCLMLYGYCSFQCLFYLFAFIIIFGRVAHYV